MVAAAVQPNMRRRHYNKKSSSGGKNLRTSLREKKANWMSNICCKELFLSFFRLNQGGRRADFFFCAHVNLTWRYQIFCPGKFGNCVTDWLKSKISTFSCIQKGFVSPSSPVFSLPIISMFWQLFRCDTKRPLFSQYTLLKFSYALHWELNSCEMFCLVKALSAFKGGMLLFLCTIKVDQFQVSIIHFSKYKSNV